MPLFDPALFDPEVFDSGSPATELPFDSIEGQTWVGKLLLGHHGDLVQLAPDPGIELHGLASGRAAARAALTVYETVGLHGEAHGSAEGAANLTVISQPTTAPGGGPATPKTPTFRYDGIDITESVEIKFCEFTASARGTPGTAMVRIRNPQMEYETGKELTCDIGGRRLWGGYVVTRRYGYYFPAAVEENRFVVLQGVDYNVFQQRRVLYDKETPTLTKLTTFPAGTPDDEVLRYYLRHHTDLSGDGVNITAGIRHVGTPSTDDEISGVAGWTLGEFLSHIRFHTGAIDYITPDKVFIHTDVDTPNAPFGISDQPEAGEIGCRDLEIDFGADSKRNDALIWGAGQGWTEPVFARATEPVEPGEISLQVGSMLPGIWRQTTAQRIADSYVYGSPQNKRGGKDDRVAVRCTVFEPGLRVADKVNVRSAVYDFEDVIPIREMRITFPTPTDPQFDLVLSHEIDDPWSTFETFWPRIDIPEPPVIDIPEPWWPPPVLPPLPEWVDGEGNVVVIGHRPPKCEGGVFSYIADDPENEFPVTVRMTSGGFFPEGATEHIGHPSEGGYYLIDGNTGTGHRGHRWQNADAIIWRSQEPLVVSGVEIDQSGHHQKNQCGRIALYVQYSPDGPWEYAGDSGPNIPPETEQAVPTLSGSLSHIGVYGVMADCVEPSWRFPGVFNVAGDWVVNEARLFATCQATTPQSPSHFIIGGEGYWANGPQVDRIDPPEGEDPDYAYIRLAGPWIPGSLLIWVDGLLLDPSTYEENSAEQIVRFENYPLGEIYVRYLPLGV